MTRPEEKLAFRAPYDTPEARGATPPRYSLTIENGVVIERDVAVTLRDGIVMYIDVFRPDGATQVPPIIGWGPYGKHVANDPSRYRAGAMNAEHMSPLAAFEAPDPAFWVPNGYAVINVNPRGTWHSEGKASFLSRQEAEDYYDVIEWAGTRPWSNGKVGLSGVSYLACSQWRVAELNPPHLAAINPWEGWSDTYREVVGHGGVPDTSFWAYIADRWGTGNGEVEDLLRETAEHPFFDDFWRNKAASFTETTVPAFVVASWTDQGLHTRGTLEGFKGISSPQKWLEVHGRKKWAYYYEPESKARLKVFFDHFLKGADNDLKSWPPVLLELREKHFVGTQIAEQEWPVARTDYQTLYLDAATGTLQPSPVTDAASQSYNSADKSEAPQHAEFAYTFNERTDIVGHMALHAFVEAESDDDMDLFVGIQKRNAAGEIEHFPYCAQFDDGPVALGWLRVSHRELDDERSTPWQPVLAHRRALPVRPGEIVEVHVEIWPSGTRFEAGESLVLIVQGSEICKSTAKAHYRHDSAVNKGRHIIHAGGAYPSRLVIPVLPGGL